MPVLVKKPGEETSELESAVEVAMKEIETSGDIRGLPKGLYFVSAKEFDVKGEGIKSCIAVFVPVPQLREYKQVQEKLVREMEKRFDGSHVVIIASRRILPKPVRGKNRKPLKQKRPRSRTLTAVHDAILSDLVFPAEVVGRRIRVKLDGKQLMKVHLDKTQQTNVEHKIDTFSSVYKRLTGKDVVFEFPTPIF